MSDSNEKKPLKDNDITKMGWKQANALLQGCVQNREPQEAEEQLNILRETAIFILGIDAYNLSKIQGWAPTDTQTHIRAVNERIKTVFIAQKGLVKDGKAEVVKPLEKKIITLDRSIIKQ